MTIFRCLFPSSNKISKVRFPSERDRNLMTLEVKLVLRMEMMTMVKRMIRVRLWEERFKDMTLDHPTSR